MRNPTITLGPLTTPEEFESWTDDQRYLYIERLGMLCGGGEPTEDDDRIARADVILAGM